MNCSKQVRRLLTLSVPALELPALAEDASMMELEERARALCIETKPVRVHELRATLQLLGAMPGRCYVNYAIAKLMEG